MSEFRENRLVGWKEYLDLPELGVFRLKAKVDTGARTSTLHVDRLEVLEVLPDGSEWVEISLHPDRRRPEHQVTARVRVLRRMRVTDSGGHREVRPVIETEMVLGPVHKRILVTLADRSGMLFRMILGRKALEGDFRVDVTSKYRFRRWHRRTPPGRRHPQSPPESFKPR
ncbi:MAG TPA: RimK/LysX family protein [Thermoanaerobaculia bacterium]|nr:RimK/LysX family protein [Thermoanaerobaculia bacterium]